MRGDDDDGATVSGKEANAPKMRANARETDVEFLPAARQKASKQSQLQVTRRVAVT